MKITVDKNIRYQKMTGFGASAAWWAQYVGKWNSVNEADGRMKKDIISELLFSKEKGIGIDIFRYNLGGGSARSGRGDIPDPARRADSFETENGYDFSRDAAAVYMMKKAVEDGAENVIFFVNSPIERLTKNSCAHTSKRAFFRTNLSRKNVPAFCKYVLDVTAHFAAEGVPVKYISPVNEPLWIWNGGQEGCHYSPSQVSYVMRVFARNIKNYPALAGVKLSGAENGDIRWFNKSYTRAMLKNREVRELCDGVDVHSYFLHSPLPAFFNDRQGFLKRYRKYLDRHFPGVPVNISEWTHMRGGKDAGMDSAVEQARVMHEDITLLNASSWQHWIACSMYDYCDGLIYIDNEKEDFELTGRYYAFGNFSKFIKKGAVRIKAECDNADMLVSAYEKDGETVIVVINPGDKAEQLSFENDVKVYVTDERNGLEGYCFSAGDVFGIAPRSVNTVIMNEQGKKNGSEG